MLIMRGVAIAHVSGGVRSPPINFPNPSSSSSSPTTRRRRRTLVLLHPASSSSSSPSSEAQEAAFIGSCPFSSSSCSCVGRRRLIFGASSAAAAATVANAEALRSPVVVPMAKDAPALQVVIERYHPRRPDWYEELYASEMEQGMKSYEAEIAVYKERLFTGVTGNFEKVLELGVGTGPNFKYYASSANMDVIGVDPNKKMEKYAQAAAEAAGLPANNFNFVQGVGEALALGDETIDAVIGTLVLCSVKDVEMALREVKRVLKPGGCYLFVEHVAAPDGTLLRFVQGVLDPLQQLVADGCHLTRYTGSVIFEAGFSKVSLESAFLSSAWIISPHVYGIAIK